MTTEPTRPACAGCGAQFDPHGPRPWHVRGRSWHLACLAAVDAGDLDPPAESCDD